MLRACGVPKGGHYLAVPPEEITLGGIVAVLDDGPTLVGCGEHAEICSRSETCATRLIWREVSQVILEKLESITLAELCQGAQDMGQGVEDVLLDGYGPFCEPPERRGDRGRRRRRRSGQPRSAAI